MAWPSNEGEIKRGDLVKVTYCEGGDPEVLTFVKVSRLGWRVVRSDTSEFPLDPRDKMEKL